MNIKRVVAVVLKETREITRDRVTMGAAFLFPIVMLFMFGYAITLEVDKVRLGVLNQDQGRASSELIDAFAESKYFTLVRSFDSQAEMEVALQSNDVKVAMVIPSGFYSEMARAEAPQVQLLIDGTYSATALVALNYAFAIVSSFQFEPQSVIKLETRIWYNPNMQSTIYIVSGMYAVILMAFPPLLTTLAIVREKESGTIQQIYASPLTGIEFITGKLIPYTVIAFIQLLMVVFVGFYWFGLPFEGSLAFLLAAGLIYVFCTVGIGLFISTIVNTQLAAVLIAMVATLMPATLFSGFVFPIFGMPDWVQLYTRFFPARYFVELSRGVVLKGATPVEMWNALTFLGIYTIAIFGAAVWRFRMKVA